VIGSSQYLSNPDLNRHAQRSQHLVLVRLQLIRTRALCTLAMALLLAATFLATSPKGVTSHGPTPPKDVP